MQCWNCRNEAVPLGEYTDIVAVAVEDEDEQIAEVSAFHQCPVCLSIFQVDSVGMGLAQVTLEELAKYTNPTPPASYRKVSDPITVGPTMTDTTTPQG